MVKKPRKTERATAPSAPAETHAAGRSIWSGQLRLALVSIPVQLISAVKTGARLAFHQIDVTSRKRIRYEKTAPGIGKVDPKNIAKGFEISKGQYVLVTEKDIDSVKIEARRTIDLIQFVDYAEIEPLYFEKPYYVVPDGKLAEEAYGVLRDALRASGKMGLGQFVMRGREYVAALRPSGQGMLLETLRFSDEVRAAAPFFAEIGQHKADPELLELATDLIKRKTSKFVPGRFHDHYTQALRALIEAKAKHKGPVIQDDAPSEKKSGNVIDLVAALRRSVQQDGAPVAAPKQRPSRKTAG
jgi:DNA end-binding protein Ku